MNIKKRIQEALTRRHKNEDGFTLIELLVVILIIAILAAVAIFALLSSLDSAKKSNAASLVSSAQVSLASIQASQGVTDYTGITSSDFTDSEKDITFTSAIPVAQNSNTVAVVKTAGSPIINLYAASDKFCFKATMQAGVQTTYGKYNVDCSTLATGSTVGSDKKAAWK
ncbi:MAG: prepilin-type N-terminal cleavage/methylation domain-containing protein [Acidimicrobiia bacterium]|nr:prepilin-type N-terminal cleavage/methylation domain-containing protein [Acidimicrobiia bacterium]